MTVDRKFERPTVAARPLLYFDNLLAGARAESVESLRFALDAIAPATCLAGSTFEIEAPAGEAWCPACTRHTPLAQREDACVHCNGYPLQVTAGTAMRVVDLRVERAGEPTEPRRQDDVRAMRLRPERHGRDRRWREGRSGDR